jgi:hypothetical protein
MAAFKAGDWVMVTPNPDLRWEHWTRDHTVFVGEYAEIVDIQSDQMDPNIEYYYLRLNSQDEEKSSEAWFLPKHVILARKADVYSSNNLKNACNELQEWEAKKRKLIDDSLRSVFGRPRQKKEVRPLRKRVALASSDEQAAADLFDDEWEDQTIEIDINNFVPADYDGWDLDGTK